MKTTVIAFAASLFGLGLGLFIAYQDEAGMTETSVEARMAPTASQQESLDTLGRLMTECFNDGDTYRAMELAADEGLLLFKIYGDEEHRKKAWEMVYNLKRNGASLAPSGPFHVGVINRKIDEYEYLKELHGID